MVYIYILFIPFKDIIPGGVGWDYSTELLQGGAVQNIESSLSTTIPQESPQQYHKNLHNNTTKVSTTIPQRSPQQCHNNTTRISIKL